MSTVDTTATLTAPAPAATSDHAPGTAQRVWSVVRLHAANPWPTLLLPWMITLAAFGLTYAVWRIVDTAVEGRVEEGAFQINGGLSWIFIYMMIAAVQAMHLTFRFALGLSVTRRDYYLGTSLYFVLLSVLYGVGLAAFGALEDLANGWGMNGGFFAPAVLGDLPWWQLAYVYVVAIMYFVFVGAAVATLYQRWGSNGIVGFFIAFAATLVALAWIITATKSWEAVGDFFQRNQVVGTASWSLVITALAALFGYRILLRATAK